MTGARLQTPYRQLTRLFLRQFLENDLISPDADRLQLLAVVGGMVVSLTLFACTFMSFTYVGAMLTPGQTAVRSLDDKFFYLALAMLATALVAASQWDVLAIDSRDAAILEPLPIPPGTIRRAKLTAVAVLGAAVAVTVNLAPSILFPWLLVFGFRQISMIGLLQLNLTHAVVTVAAAAFGYFTVIACREMLAALFGPRGFTRVSPWAQGALIVLLGSALLLLAPASDGIARRGFDGWRAHSPPMWFLGIYEATSGGIIADLPRRRMTPRQANNDRITSRLYAERRAQFPAMAGRAGLALVLMLVLAITAYAWNARQVPALAAALPSATRRRWRLGARAANVLLVRDPAARAGFYFTFAALWRSNTHRLTLAGAAAAGLAMAVVALSGAEVTRSGGASVRLLLVQPLVYGALLVGFRHLIRVPAELRANWGFQLAWQGRHRAFTEGVKRAAVVALVLPALAVLWPLFAFALGPRLAIAHAALGLAGAIVLLEAVMLQYDKVPFTCTYVPSEHAKVMAPIYTLAFFVGLSVFVRLQHAALAGTGVVAVLVTLAVVFVVLRLILVMRPRVPPVEFDEAPAGFQGLGLNT